jgi:signal transduction histidine kinase
LKLLNPKIRQKFAESLKAVLPVVGIVIVLSFTIAPITSSILLCFLVGAVMVMAGMMFFTLGAEMSMTPMGEKVGARMTQSKNILLIVVLSFLLGVVITISEPDLQVLIEQVTINLLENAIVHSGSILPIDFIVEDHPEHVSFIVRDYGKGLSEEKLQNLFETGTYNNSRSSDSRKGMGIGLSICKTIITAHHGTLSGRNHADGAEFCFTLPKAEALASEK